MQFDVRRACALALIVTSAALAACGDDDEPEPAATPEATATQQAEDTPEASGGGETLQIDATEDGGLGFDPEELTAAAGTVTIEMANPDGNQLPHAVELEGNGIEEVGDTVQAGGTSTVTAEVEAGEYTFYCPVGDHRAGGMEGTLTVE
jgi:plastocyanin